MGETTAAAKPSARLHRLTRAGRRRAGFFALVAGLLLFLPQPSAHSAARRPVRAGLEADPLPVVLEIPLTVHVATQEGLPVVSRWYVLSAVARANRELRRFGVQLRVRAVELLPEGHSRLTRGRDRLRLADHAFRDGSVHVFWVDRVELYDPRHGDQAISGMHWRYRGGQRRLRQREYVAVSRDAPLSTLVHEVGHIFGLGHRHATENVMCSCERVATPSFTGTQGRQLRAGARRFLLRAGGS